MDWTIPHPFVQPLNFLDPLLSSTFKEYSEKRLKDLIRGRYLISRFTHTSYLDVGYISPLERDYILEFITEEKEEEQKKIEESKQKRKRN